MSAAGHVLGSAARSSPVGGVGVGVGVGVWLVAGRASSRSRGGQRPVPPTDDRARHRWALAKSKLLLGGVTPGWPKPGRPGASQVLAERQTRSGHGNPLTPPAPGARRTAALRTNPRAVVADTPADTRRECPPAPRGDR